MIVVATCSIPPVQLQENHAYLLPLCDGLRKAFITSENATLE